MTEDATRQVAVGALDGATVEEAAGLLHPCCASRTWLDRMVRGRPYGTLERVSAASTAAITQLTWADIEEALAAHPRIGQRAIGTTREAEWSRQEQAGTVRPAAGTEQALRDGNAEYEQRFGHVFLIRAAGRSAEQILAVLRARLGNDAAAEREVVRGQLGEIVGLRLAKAFR